MSKTPRILIEDYGSGKHVVTNTHVWIISEDDEGNEQRTEISNLVRRVNVDMKVGDPLIATLEVFVAGFQSRAQASEILAVYLRPLPWWKRLWRRRQVVDITTYNPTGVKEFYE